VISNNSRDRAPSRSDGRGRRPILLIDTIGELSAWWGTARIAFVGGSFGSRGGQNMIEPAAYGAAVSFGPNTWNFRDIVATLLAADGAAVVPNAAALESFVRRCLNDTDYTHALGMRAQALVQSQLGATYRTAELITSVLGAQPTLGAKNLAAA
jgi:3-deoxy-D-manno-octulosonic-acid transferase